MFSCRWVDLAARVESAKVGVEDRGCLLTQTGKMAPHLLSFGSLEVEGKN